MLKSNANRYCVAFLMSKIVTDHEWSKRFVCLACKFGVAYTKARGTSTNASVIPYAALEPLERLKRGKGTNTSDFEDRLGFSSLLRRGNRIRASENATPDKQLRPTRKLIREPGWDGKRLILLRLISSISNEGIIVN